MAEVQANSGIVKCRGCRLAKRESFPIREDVKDVLVHPIPAHNLGVFRKVDDSGVNGSYTL